MTNNTTDTPIDRGTRNVATASYVTPIGWLITFALTRAEGKPHSFARFHLRQAFGLHAVALPCLLITHAGTSHTLVNILYQFVWVAYILCMVIGATAAQNGQSRYQPFLGKRFAKIFSFI